MAEKVCGFLSSKTHQYCDAYFKSRNYEWGELLFSTQRGDEMKLFRDYIQGRGLTLTVLEGSEETVDGRGGTHGPIVFVAGTSSAWPASVSRVEVMDSEAVLFDGCGCHVAVVGSPRDERDKPNVPTVVYGEPMRCGPSWAKLFELEFERSTTFSLPWSPTPTTAHPSAPLVVKLSGAGGKWKSKMGMRIHAVHIFRVVVGDGTRRVETGSVARAVAAANASLEPTGHLLLRPNQPDAAVARTALPIDVPVTPAEGLSSGSGPLVLHPQMRSARRYGVLVVPPSQAGRGDFAAQVVDAVRKHWESVVSSSWDLRRNNVVMEVKKCPPPNAHQEGTDSTLHGGYDRTVTVQLTYSAAKATSLDTAVATSATTPYLDVTLWIAGSAASTGTVLTLNYRMEDDSIVANGKETRVALDLIVQHLLQTSCTPQQQPQRAACTAVYGGSSNVPCRTSEVRPQRIEDRPHLLHAQQLGAGGTLTGAITGFRGQHMPTTYGGEYQRGGSSNSGRRCTGTVAVVAADAGALGFVGRCAAIVSSHLVSKGMTADVTTPADEPSRESATLVVRLVLLQGGRCWTLPDAGPRVLYVAIADQPPPERPTLNVFNYNPAAEGQISEGGPHTVAALAEIARRISKQ